MRRPPSISLAAAALALVAAAQPAAIVNKATASAGRRDLRFANPTEMAGELFGRSFNSHRTLSLIVAAVLLGALMALIVGMWRTLRGDREGVDIMLSGVYGLVGIMVAIGVVM